MYDDLLLQSRQIAYNAYTAYLSNKTLVSIAVYPMLNSTNQNIIYNDNKFGFNNIEGVIWWVFASQGNATAVTAIQDNFKRKGVVLTD
jgi:hypothetical protein